MVPQESHRISGGRAGSRKRGPFDLWYWARCLACCPQAGLAAALVQGVFVGDPPWDMITMGVVLGAGVILLLES